MIRELDMGSAATRQAVLDVSLDAYRVEAELLGVSHFPPLQETLDDLATHSHSFWGHHRTTELLGVIELNMEPDQVEICRLVVARNAFRLGIGSALVQFAIDRGLPTRVTTAQANVPAIRLYERHGFQIVTIDESRVPGLPLVDLIRPA